MHVEAGRCDLHRLIELLLLLGRLMRGQALQSLQLLRDALDLGGARAVSAGAPDQRPRQRLQQQRRAQHDADDGESSAHVHICRRRHAGRTKRLAALGIRAPPTKTRPMRPKADGIPPVRSRLRCDLSAALARASDSRRARARVDADSARSNERRRQRQRDTPPRDIGYRLVDAKRCSASRGGVEGKGPTNVRLPAFLSGLLLGRKGRCPANMRKLGGQVNPSIAHTRTLSSTPRRVRRVLFLPTRELLPQIRGASRQGEDAARPRKRLGPRWCGAARVHTTPYPAGWVPHPRLAGGRAASCPGVLVPIGYSHDAAHQR
eukprot:364491-Chlamydomonas_euryale.AAC.8